MQLLPIIEPVWEFGRLGIVYVHLIACCIAIGLVFTSDVAMVKQLLRGAAPRTSAKDLSTLQSTVTTALVFLWITGAALIGIDSLDRGLEYFTNPKIQAKIAIVCILTLNGVLLHRAVMPALKKAGDLLSLAFSHRLLAIFAGSVSGVSWFYAAMLGVGRPLNWKYSLPELLVAYPVLVGGGVALMLVLTAWAKYRSAGMALEPEFAYAHGRKVK